MNNFADFDMALSTAEKVQTIGKNASAHFIAREDTIDALVSSICSAEHMVMLGGVGTAKSALARFFADSMGLKFYKTNMNPDLVREHLIGPNSLQALRKDEWKIKLAGLATSDFALIDEVGKASGQVMNMLLKIFEERLVEESPDLETPIPLHTAIGASNETFEYDSPALWDRFTVRTSVRYINRPPEFLLMLDTQPANIIPVEISRAELENLRSALSQTVYTKEIKECLLEMWQEFPNLNVEVASDRRWKKILKVATGRAFAHGFEQPREEDLTVARWILWKDPDDIETIEEWVDKRINLGVVEIENAEARLEEIEDEFMSGDSTSYEAKSTLVFRAMRLKREAATMLNDSSNRFKARWESVSDRSEKISSKAIDRED